MKHLNEVEQQLDADGAFIGLGMWSDGVPMSWDRSESVQCITWNLPGLTEKGQRCVRIPFTVIPKHFCNSQTLHYLLELFGWSLQQMFMGVFPSAGPDGNAFEEAYRKQLAGKPMAYKALLLEMKGDWEFYANVLYLPRWKNKEGICFLCRATKKHLSENLMTASWRQADMRVDHDGLLQRLREHKKCLAPIWQYPMFRQCCLKLDWLHIADQGVTAAFAGSLLCLFVDPPGVKDFGPTIEDRRSTLWQLLLHYYKDQKMHADKLKRACL